MNRRLRNEVLFFLMLIRFLFIFCFFATSAYASPSRNLTIFAEPNLATALTKISRIYSPKANIIISLNFSSASNLISNIDLGEPVDIFISAHQGWIDSLHQKGVIDVYNIGYVAHDELVLITPKNNQKLPEQLAKMNFSLKDSLNILNENKATIIFDDEGSSSGFFAKNFFDAAAYPNIKTFNKIAEDKTSFLSIIKSNPENYALLLSSQIKNNNDFLVLSTETEKNIFYQAIVIAGDNMEVAREFLKFLKTETAKKIFKESGFIVD